MARIYAACLAAYNNGILHGRWIEASSDTDEMQEAITAMLKASPMPDAEEWAVHDYEDLPQEFGEYPGLEKIAAYIEFLEDFDHVDEGDLQAIVANFHDVDQAASEMRERFIGIYAEFCDYSSDHADELMGFHTGEVKVPQFLIDYFDYDAFEHDLKMEMTIVDCPSGVAVFHQ